MICLPPTFISDLVIKNEAFLAELLIFFTLLFTVLLLQLLLELIRLHLLFTFICVQFLITTMEILVCHVLVEEYSNVEGRIIITAILVNIR